MAARRPVEEPSVLQQDGRRTCWAEYGHPAGAPLVVLHGTPGSRLQAGWFAEAARAAGVRVIAPDRPGYGGSDPVPGGATPTGWAEDYRRLLDHLDLPAATLAALSGAGGFGLATAVALPRRVRRLVLVSAGYAGPRSTERGMALPVRALMAMAARAPRLTGRLLAAQVAADPSSRGARWARRGMHPGDRRRFEEPAVQAHLRADFSEALRQGPTAAVDDLRLARRPLGVDPAELTVDTVALHGTEDANVPIGLPRWLVTVAPSARLVELAGEGHLWVFERPGLLLEQVAR